jgi:hypothetical protein
LAYFELNAEPIPAVQIGWNNENLGEIYTLLSTSHSCLFAAEISLGFGVYLLDEDVCFNKTNSGHFVMNGNREKVLAHSSLITV